MKHRFDEPNVARRIAQLLVANSFDSTKVAKLWAPEVKFPGPLGARMMSSPEVQRQLEKILNRTDRNAQKFLDMNWELFEKFHGAVMKGEDVGKELMEAGLNANRVMARGYVSEKKGPDTAAGKALVIDASPRELSNLVDAPTKPGKPM